MWYMVYQMPESILMNFAADLYGKRVSKHLYKIPPNRYVVKLNNKYRSYGASLYSGDSVSGYQEVGFQSFSSLVDPSTFRFVREEKNGMIYVFEDKGYVYEYFFEAETRFCATIKKIRK